MLNKPLQTPCEMKRGFSCCWLLQTTLGVEVTLPRYRGDPELCCANRKQILTASHGSSHLVYITAWSLSSSYQRYRRPRGPDTVLGLRGSRCCRRMWPDTKAAARQLLASSKSTLGTPVRAPSGVAPWRMGVRQAHWDLSQSEMAAQLVSQCAANCM